MRLLVQQAWQVAGQVAGDLHVRPPGGLAELRQLVVGHGRCLDAQRRQQISCRVAQHDAVPLGYHDQAQPRHEGALAAQHRIGGVGRGALVERGVPPRQVWVVELDVRETARIGRCRARIGETSNDLAGAHPDDVPRTVQRDVMRRKVADPGDAQDDLERGPGASHSGAVGPGDGAGGSRSQPPHEGVPVRGHDASATVRTRSPEPSCDVACAQLVAPAVPGITSRGPAT